MNDKVNHPEHYSMCSIECIDMMKLIFGNEAVGDFCLMNAFKYIWRCKFKGGFEDLDKAEWYLDYAWSECVVSDYDNWSVLNSMLRKLRKEAEENK